MSRSATLALAVTALLACTVALTQDAAALKFPAKGKVKLSTNPLKLFVHYINGSKESVDTELRNLSFAPPDLSRAKSMNAIAQSPCELGDRIIVEKSKFSGEATGTDAYGIGRMVWVLDGVYTSDGKTWRFVGKVAPAPDTYDFNKEKIGTRKFVDEVLTRLGSEMPGESFEIKIAGSLDVEITGICSLSAAGTAIA